MNEQRQQLQTCLRDIALLAADYGGCITVPGLMNLIDVIGHVAHIGLARDKSQATWLLLGAQQGPSGAQVRASP